MVKAKKRIHMCLGEKKRKFFLNKLELQAFEGVDAWLAVTNGFHFFFSFFSLINKNEVRLTGFRFYLFCVYSSFMLIHSAFTSIDTFKCILLNGFQHAYILI